MSAKTGSVSVHPKGAFKIAQKLETVTVLGVPKKPSQVEVNGKGVSTSTWEWLSQQEKLVVKNAGANLNEVVTVSWK